MLQQVSENFGVLAKSHHVLRLGAMSEEGKGRQSSPAAAFEDKYQQWSVLLRPLTLMAAMFSMIARVL